MVSVTIPGGVTNIGYWAFYKSLTLTQVFFMGSPPTLGVTPFDTVVTLFYLPGSTGWGTNVAGCPTVLWNPQVMTHDSNFGVRTNEFGFNITGNSNVVVVVQASSDLSNPDWFPLQTNRLNGNPLYVSDPQTTNYPVRFYRLRWP